MTPSTRKRVAEIINRVIFGESTPEAQENCENAANALYDAGLISALITSEPPDVVDGGEVSDEDIALVIVEDLEMQSRRSDYKYRALDIVKALRAKYSIVKKEGT